MSRARPVRQRRDQRHRGRAAADHDDALARVVDLIGPVLRMDDLAAESIEARNSAGALVVAVVAGAPTGSRGQLGTSRRCRRARRRRSSAHRPIDHAAPTTRWWKRICGRSRSRARSRGRTPGSRVRRRSPAPRPGAERVAERVHVRVGADPRDSGTGPRYRRSLARFEDRERLGRTSSCCRHPAPMPEIPAPMIRRLRLVPPRACGDCAVLGKPTENRRCPWPSRGVRRLPVAVAQEVNLAAVAIDAHPTSLYACQGSPTTPPRRPVTPA